MKHSMWQYLLFFCMVLLAFSLRGPEILAGNYLFGFDQGRDYLAAYSIVHDHKFTLIGAEVGAGSAGITGLFHGPGYFYLLSVFYLLFHGDPYGGLVLMFIAGMATVIVTFIVAKKIFGTSGGLLAMFLVSLAPLITTQSRFVWNHHPTSLLIIIYFYLLYELCKEGLEGKAELGRLGKKVFLITFVAGLMYNFELAISVPLVLSTLVILLLIIRRQRIQTFAVWVTGVILTYLPMLLFEARHQFIALRGMLGYLTGHTEHSSSFTWQLFQLHFSSFVANARDTFVFESGFITQPYFATTILLLFFTVVLSFILTKNTTHKRFIGSLFIIIITSFIVFSFLNNSIWNYYLLHLHFVYILFFTFAFVTLTTYSTFNVDSMEKTPHVRWGMSVGGFFFLCFFLFSMSNGVASRILLNWRVDYPDYGGKEKITGKRSMIDTIFKDANGQPFNVLVFTPPVYTYSYDYLFKTYAWDTYHYIPGHEKKGLVYLIMEIDGQKRWSYQGWLDTVIKTGTILSHQYLTKEDVIIEKRMFP